MPNLRERTAQLERDLSNAICELIGEYKCNTGLQVKSVTIKTYDASVDGGRPEYVFAGLNVEVVV